MQPRSSSGKRARKDPTTTGTKPTKPLAPHPPKTTSTVTSPEKKLQFTPEKRLQSLYMDIEAKEDNSIHGADIAAEAAEGEELARSQVDINASMEEFVTKQNTPGDFTIDGKIYKIIGPITWDGVTLKKLPGNQVVSLENALMFNLLKILNVDDDGGELLDASEDEEVSTKPADVYSIRRIIEDGVKGDTHNVMGVICEVVKRDDRFIVRLLDESIEDGYFLNFTIQPHSLPQEKQMYLAESTVIFLQHVTQNEFDPVNLESVTTTQIGFMPFHDVALETRASQLDFWYPAFGYDMKPDTPLMRTTTTKAARALACYAGYNCELEVTIVSIETVKTYTTTKGVVGKRTEIRVIDSTSTEGLKIVVWAPEMNAFLESRGMPAKRFNGKAIHETFLCPGV